MSILEDIKTAIRSIGAKQRLIDDKLTAMDYGLITRTHTCIRSNFDPVSQLYTTMHYKRMDNSTAMISTLGGWDETQQVFMTRTETYYRESTGDLIRTVNYTITHGEYRLPLSETISSVVLA